MTSIEEETPQEQKVEATQEDPLREPETLKEFLMNEDMDKDRFPFAVVWNAVPFLSWILPFLGHVGICDSVGRIWDFQETNKIGIHRMKYGRVLKVWRFYEKPKESKEPKENEMDDIEQQENLIYESHSIPGQWDKAIESASQTFLHRKLSWTKCNSWHHVCECLNIYKPDLPKKFTPKRLCWTLIKKGSYPSCSMAINVYLPVVVLVLLFLIIISGIQLLLMIRSTK
ncbi:putative Protein of unknown function (DUF778) [Monocercomonoides exilis]|uniref:putative Protein of unknown function (DUF778) n=1 Tax=Monocercomonoides exilis TaxID=2049356 RepID=UPI00355A94D5|nr:putative Protein of unknown function (DUF778) [Monocercomonoides exilis]|eukprot:MONOS_8063.1-p1 / transcript=MONOS_8063.1 / gene=MONOS_8063 / organism=Monocercomonoides_exilis_PA203 / gene_product=unspecified product / transcript_product=unspecified product / location=Mono_scaffold00293:68259-69288(-) / protein_length=227 / sequence_SO=supercontig / SO=protein_coding / is_pseudo=false